MDESTVTTTSPSSTAQRIPFEVLSVIFELCSTDDWKSPMRISAVSRWWRQVVLNTPFAWQFVDLRSAAPSNSNIYIERSGQYLLHVNSTLSTIMALGLPDRVQCMTLNAAPGYEDNAVFPHLQHLCLQGANALRLGSMNMFTFPLLRHLEVGGPTGSLITHDELPPLETLVVAVYSAEGWPGLLKECTLSLTSLSLTVISRSSFWFNSDTFDLPNLTYLKIVDKDPNFRLLSHKLVTPVLVTYIAQYANEEMKQTFLCPTLKSVTHMRLVNQLPSISESTRLQTLQLDMPFVQAVGVVIDIEAGRSSYPSLERLEFRTRGWSSDQISRIKKRMPSWDWSDFPRILSPNDDWSVKLPGEDERICGGNTPCSKWH
ncbi:hypothetical protein M408DRAFT_330213 [Serendipita vermifera MAFF 305830]|uniref:Uncharacterized protein n=1 Tax=Serendipita vermifera MAFF 305830 TaxID=933852 RepID=A0A0C3AR92_SERVB|nr:hypothetical protein M408DRAFT_330213 [Serendipita vermifera MAFF 305830]